MYNVSTMRKILIVDDDPLLGNLYRDLLMAQQYEVTLVIDGDVAFENIKNNNWDLILLDILLPHRSGSQIIRDLQATSPDSLKQNIVLLTGLDKTAALEEIKDLHYPIISKSEVNPDEFILKVQSYLSAPTS